MLRALKNKISGISGMKKITLLLCIVWILTIGIGSTYSYVVTGTPTLFNYFLNGMNPDGDLIIQKTVSHPFGDTYSVPDDISFTFEVNLGEEYAGETVKTSQGEKTADENGMITVTVAPEGRTTVYDIDDETVVTVTEINIGGGFVPDAVSQEIKIQKHQDNLLMFTNAYTPEKADTSALTVSGIKNLVGREWTLGDSFTFELEVNNAGTWESVGTQTITYELVEQPDPENPENKILVPKPDFDKFDFTELIRTYVFDTAGTYSFRVSEVEGTIGGLTYDKAESKFDVLVGDADMDGYLEIQSITTTTAANTTVEGMAVNISFENRYAAVGSSEIYIEILKVLEDTSGQNKSPAGFTFELYDEENNRIAVSDSTSSTGETSIRLVYEPTDAGKTFTYILKETSGGQTVGAWTYDGTEYKIQVSVVDNLDGTVSAYVYDWQEPVADVQSDIPAETAGVVDSIKGVTEDTELMETIENTEASDESFLSSDDAGSTAETVSVDGMSEETENTQASENGDATVSSDDTGIAQTTDAENNDLLTVSLMENAAVVIPEGATDTYKATFINRYDPLDATVDIRGTKILSGRDMKDGEFTFLLYQTDKRFTLAEGAKPIDTKVNVSGAFSFETLTFDKVGTYYYVVTEDASAALGGVTYDNAYYLVTVVVTDTEGVLMAAVSVTDSYGEEKDIVFVNVYKAAPVSLPLSGKKTLAGAEMKDYRFLFNLYVADENFTALSAAFQTVSNDDNGEISFTDLSFTQAGTYRYVVVEDTSAEIEGMTYDDTVYQISVVVSDPGNGQLVIDTFAITADGETVDDIIFENSYTKPVDSDKPVNPEESTTPEDPDEPIKSTTPENSTDASKTGDSNSLMLWIVVMILSLAGIAAVLLWRHKKQ